MDGDRLRFWGKCFIDNVPGDAGLNMLADIQDYSASAVGATGCILFRDSPLSLPRQSHLYYTKIKVRRR